MKPRCTNRECMAEFKYLRGGRLSLMDREPKNSADPSKRSVAMRKYFWLCENCASQYVIQRWTEDGVELRRRYRPQSTRPIFMAADNLMLPGLVG